MAYEPMNSKQLLSEIETLRLRLDELEASEYALKQTEDALRETRERFLHLIEHTPDSFFVIEEDGRFSDVNERACQSLGYAREELLTLSIMDIDDGLDATGFKEALAQFAPDVSAMQERAFRRKDGTTFSVEVRADLTMMEGKRRLFALARDVTEQERAQEVTERLAQENAVLSEIGRIISSSVNIDEVYPRFAEEVRKLIPFDRIVIGVTDLEHGTGRISYDLGIGVSGRRTGNILPLEGTIAAEAIGKKSAVLIQGDELSDFNVRFPSTTPSFVAGLKSFLTVPLFSGNEVIGALNIRSHQPNAYTQRDLELAERIGNQIAGAMANSLLYSELKQTEEANDRLAQENAVLAEIGRVISSSLDIDEVYDRFAEEVRKLISFDRVVISMFDPEHGVTRISYVVGADVPGLRVGDSLPLAGAATSEALDTRSGVLVQGGDLDYVESHFPSAVPLYKAGLRSLLLMPLVSGNEVIGTLNLHSFGPNAFTPRDLELAERIGNQIAGAISNSLLYSELKQTEEANDRLAQENAVLAEIGRVISSSVDIGEVYERFTDVVRTIIPFDRSVVSLLNTKEGVFTNAYVVGVDAPVIKPGDTYQLPGSFFEDIVRTRSGRLIHVNDDNRDELLRQYPTLLPGLEAGVRSIIAVPLVSDDEVIGVLRFRSIEPNAFTQRDVDLAERIGNQIAGAIANSMLYSELKQSGEALQENEERFRQMAEHVPEVFWLYDFETEQVLYVSPAFKEIFPSTANDLYANRDSWMEAIHPDDKERVHDIYKNHRKEELNFEFRIVRPDDSIRWISTRRTPVRNEAGEIYRLVGIAEDITERKLLEEQLVQSQKLESVGRLAGGVAHDFNNLLTPIIGYSQMAMRSLHPEDKVRTQLQHIYQAAERASNLIHQLLTFSSKQIIEPKVVSLSRLILDMDHLLRRLIGEDIELITRPKPDLGLVKVDHGQLEQVLVNLAVNARDAMQDGGRLIIEADDITVDKEFAQIYPGLTPGEYVLMAVRDNGKGMKAEVRTRIFEPFYTTKERGKGTGLGLSICYGIVKQSGGHIFVESEPGQGTTFKIYLPRVEGIAEMPLPTDDSHPLPRGTESVLLVEDEVSVREIVAYVLREQGYTVYEAVNGRDALRIAQGDMGEELHLLITDVIMPGMGGVELVDQFKPLCPEVKVLFISGYTEDDVVHHGMLDHSTAMLLQKPFTPAELTDKVREVLDA